MIQLTRPVTEIENKEHIFMIYDIWAIKVIGNLSNRQLNKY